MAVKLVKSRGKKQMESLSSLHWVLVGTKGRWGEDDWSLGGLAGLAGRWRKISSELWRVWTECGELVSMFSLSTS